MFDNSVITRFSTAETLRKALKHAYMLGSKVLIPGASVSGLIQRSMLADVKQIAVIVYVAIDQGGCVEISRAATHQELTYIF